MPVTPPARKRAVGARGRGFTLVELMVVIALMAILLGLAVPALRTFLVRRAVVAQTDAYISSVRLARSEAMKRGTVVAICRTDDATIPLPECGEGAVGADEPGWANGWIVFADPDNDFVVADAAEILRVQPLSVAVRSMSGDRSRLRFRPDGPSVGYNGSLQVTPEIEDATQRDALTRCLVTSMQGRVRVTSGACP